MDRLDKITLLNPTMLEAGDKIYECRIGREGFASNKREGDLKTPIGRFALRCCYFRPDRVAPPPKTQLPLIELSRNDGWCDDAAHPLYNQRVKLPFAASHEKLWRDDGLYDLIIPLGYNDGPIVPGKGSAIFMHVRRPDGVGTEGCIALAKLDLLSLLPRLSPATELLVRP